jgi:hypothetical protein
MISRRQQRQAGSEAESKPAGPSLPILAVIAAAARTGRQHLWSVIAVSVAVSLTTAGMEIVVSDLADRTNVSVALLTSFSATSVSLLGEVFLSGFLCRLVSTQHAGLQHTGAQPHRRRADGTRKGGKADTAPAQVARSLPWWRLIGADLLVVLLVVLGLVALVIPGLILLNLLAVTGPVIEIEDRRVLSALRRSARLVWQHFWPVALLATVPLILAGGLESVDGHPGGPAPILTALAIRGLGGAVVQAAIGLVLVQLCYQLIALGRAAGAQDNAAPAAGTDVGPVSGSPPA